MKAADRLLLQPEGPQARGPPSSCCTRPQGPDVARSEVEGLGECEWVEVVVVAEKADDSSSVDRQRTKPTVRQGQHDLVRRRHAFQRCERGPRVADDHPVTEGPGAGGQRRSEVRRTDEREQRRRPGHLDEQSHRRAALHQDRTARNGCSDSVPQSLAGQAVQPESLIPWSALRDRPCPDDSAEELGGTFRDDADSGRGPGRGGGELLGDAFPAEHVRDHREFAPTGETAGRVGHSSIAVPLQQRGGSGEHAPAGIEGSRLHAPTPDAPDHRALPGHRHRGPERLRRAPEDVHRGGDRDGLPCAQQRQQLMGELEHLLILPGPFSCRGPSRQD